MMRQLCTSFTSLFVLGTFACSSSNQDERQSPSTGQYGGSAGLAPGPASGGTNWSSSGGSQNPGGPPPTGAGGILTGAGGLGVAPNGAGGFPPVGGAPQGNGGFPPVGAGGSPPQGAGGLPPQGAGGSTPAGTGGSTPIPPPTGGCLNPGNGDYSKPGPYKVATEVVDLGTGIDSQQTTGKFTIFYPQQFEANCPHPIAAWGNGTGVNGDSLDAYSFFHQSAASWGIVDMAAHDPNTGSGSYHKAAIEYLLKANADPSSKFYQKLSTYVGVSGHSQGGFGASRAASHPNVKALITVGASGPAVPQYSFLCLTGTQDIAPDACKQSISSATGPALAAIWDGGDHVTTETLAGYVGNNAGTIQMMRLYTAFYRCYLAADDAACKMFTGAPTNCGICKDAGWSEILAKNL